MDWYHLWNSFSDTGFAVSSFSRDWITVKPEDVETRKLEGFVVEKRINVSKMNVSTGAMHRSGYGEQKYPVVIMWRPR